MATKKKTAKLKAVIEKPARWTIQVNRGLLDPFTKMAKMNGMTVGGAASVALTQWLIKMQAEVCMAWDGKEKDK